MLSSLLLFFLCRGLLSWTANQIDLSHRLLIEFCAQLAQKSLKGSNSVERHKNWADRHSQTTDDRLGASCPLETSNRHILFISVLQRQLHNFPSLQSSHVNTILRFVTFPSLTFIHVALPFLNPTSSALKCHVSPRRHGLALSRQCFVSGTGLVTVSV